MLRFGLVILVACSLPIVASAAETAPAKDAPTAAKAATPTPPARQAPSETKPPLSTQHKTTETKAIKESSKSAESNHKTRSTLTATHTCMPYVGEHLAFKIGWEFINAGSTTLDITSIGDHGWQVKTLARTNTFLDAFRKVRDHITAEGVCVDGEMQSTLFDADLHERKYKAKKRTEYLWLENKVTHSQNQITEHFDVPAGHLSVIDAFLAVRGLTLTPGQTVNIPVFDSRKQYEIEVNILPRKETLKAPWGEKVSCILVKPKLKTAGIFTNKGEMLLWMTDDARHIPLKMKAKIKFGSIYAHLTSYTKDAPLALLAKDDANSNRAEANAATDPVKAPSKHVK